MAFDASSLVGEPTLERVGRELLVAWTSTAPDGTIFQVYADKRLAWAGTDRRIFLPWPRERIEIQVGAVAAGEAGVDFSGSLSDVEPPDRVTLSWLGGSYLGDVAGFRVYQSAAAGGSVDYSAPVGFLPLTTASAEATGYGCGGYGSGGYGLAASSYEWTSARLGSGVWSFAVAPVDPAGNEGTPSTGSRTVSAAPRPPAPDAQGRRLTYTYDAGTGVPTLHWNASP